MKKSKRAQLLPEIGSYDEMDSPVGRLTIVTSPAGLHAILWENDLNHSIHQSMQSLIRSSDEKTIVATKKQLLEYFQGQRKSFDLSLAMKGTEFQMLAWQQLLKIPYGSTVSYEQQAEGIGDKKKARAVGIANGQNLIPIIIPCHRVIGKNGRLVGFGGGINNKAYLLGLERNFL